MSHSGVGPLGPLTWPPRYLPGDIPLDSAGYAQDSWSELDGSPTWWWLLGHALAQAGWMGAQAQQAHKRGFNAGYVQGVSDSPC